jgi:hypothetical protein
MAWPKGKPRKPRLIAGEMLVPESQAAEPRRTFSKPERWTMKAGANWETAVDDDASVDKLHIPRDMIPEGMDLQWVTTEVCGQAVPQHTALFTRKGWTPVHPEDFGGRFDGMFTARGDNGPIQMGGLVLMARPIELTKKARAKDKAAAREQVAIKEAALGAGNLEGVTLDAQHPSALKTNRISRSWERIEVPKE